MDAVGRGGGEGEMNWVSISLAWSVLGPSFSGSSAWHGVRHRASALKQCAEESQVVEDFTLPLGLKG